MLSRQKSAVLQFTTTNSNININATTLEPGVLILGYYCATTNPYSPLHYSVPSTGKSDIYSLHSPVFVSQIFFFWLAFKPRHHCCIIQQQKAHSKWCLAFLPWSSPLPKCSIIFFWLSVFFSWNQCTFSLAHSVRFDCTVLFLVFLLHFVLCTTSCVWFLLLPQQCWKLNEDVFLECFVLFSKLKS